MYEKKSHKIAFVNTLILIGVLLTSPSQAQLITKWQVTDSNEVITIPTTGFGYNYIVNWGDGNSSAGTGNVSHTYKLPGIYTVSITGAFPRIYFNDSSESKDKIIEINQWGTNAWKSMKGAFRGCSNLNIVATDTPALSGVTDLSLMFYDCKSLNPVGAAAIALNNWHTGAVTTMEGMFWGATAFNQNIGDWNTANVTNMYGMFEGATAFNQDIGNWNTGNVTNMRTMFESATVFNQDIGNWNTAKVTNMDYMFWEATAFNQGIGLWNTANVTQMGYMFFGATAFNQDIGNWNTAKVIDMYAMFWGATAFNQDIGNWKIANLTNMRAMLDNSGLSVANYDNTLIGWAGQAPPSDIVLGAQDLKYCAGAEAREKLISTYSWSITGDSLSCALPTSLVPKVFPNPTTGTVKIINIKIGDVILLTDVIGQKLLQQLATDETQMLNIHLMAQGIYLISIIRSGKIVITYKITKLN